MNCIKYLDLFEIKFHFYLNNQPNYQNIFGGIMSFIFYFICIFGFILFSLDDLKQLDPITSKSEIPDAGMRTVNVLEEKIWIPFRMVTYEEQFVDHRGILFPLLYYVEGKWNNSIGMDLKYHLLSYKLCNETSMANKPDRYKINAPLNELFCIDNDDLPFGGSWNGNYLYFLEYNLHLCQNGINFNASDPRCTKLEDLLQHKNTSWLFEFYYPVVQYQPTNFNVPLAVIYRSYFYRLATYMNKVERIYIGQHILSDEKSLINTKKENREKYEKIADKIVYTGKIDEYFGYKFGKLQYRTVRWDNEVKDVANFQGAAVINHPDKNVPYTRVIEHKHFEPHNKELQEKKKTVVSKEFSEEWDETKEGYYPVNDEKNNKLYQQYKELADKETNVIFGGRLAEYKYYDMKDVIEAVFKKWDIN